MKLQDKVSYVYRTSAQVLTVLYRFGEIMNMEKEKTAMSILRVRTFAYQLVSFPPSTTNIEKVLTEQT